MKTVNELQAEINRLKSEIVSIKRDRTHKNRTKLLEECYNLFEGVGKGYVEGDYYADTRYYSEIPGVKNIRINNWQKEYPRIEVKIVSPSGYLLPSTIEINGEVCEVVIYKSSKYRSEVDY